MSLRAALVIFFVLFVGKAYSYHISIVVFGWKREASLKRLLGSLTNPKINYQGHQLDLSINLDGGYTNEVLDLVTKFTWKHGQKTISKRNEHVGLAENVMNSWNPGIDDENNQSSMAIFLEDDIELSPYFFEFLITLLRKIDLNPNGRKDLFGISLNTPKFDEISLSSWGPWSPVSKDSSLTTQDLLFKFQLPSSWGSLYFATEWKKFQSYYKRRQSCQIGHKLLPKSGSTYWKESWKRYLIEWMALKPLTMLYPNLPSQTSYSIHHREKGIHSTFNGPAKQDYSPKEEALKDEEYNLYGVPLLNDIKMHLPMLRYIENLPEDLRVIALSHKEVPNFTWLKNNSKILKEIFKKECPK